MFVGIVDQRDLVRWTYLHVRCDAIRCCWLYYEYWWGCE